MHFVARGDEPERLVVALVAAEEDAEVNAVLSEAELQQRHEAAVKRVPERVADVEMEQRFDVDLGGTDVL